jgi:putative transcriptional regulator
MVFQSFPKITDNMCLYGTAPLTTKVKFVGHAEAQDSAEATLHNAGFNVSRRCTSRMSCFDFAARKDDNGVFVKVIPDIRDICRDDAIELKAISSLLGCSSLFISDLNHQHTLKDDTVYSRYNVRVVTSKTLEDVVRGAFPLIEATPGGYCVRMDGDKIRRHRHNLGLSIGKLAGMAGISRRALYGYERELTRASVSVAYQLEEVLGVVLVKHVNIFNCASKKTGEKQVLPNKLPKAENGFLNLVLNKLSQFNLKVSSMKRAPFDFAAHFSRQKIRIIGGVFCKEEKYAPDRMAEIVSLCKVVEAKPLLICEKKAPPAPDNVIFLAYNELDQIEDTKELATLL